MDAPRIQVGSRVRRTADTAEGLVFAVHEPGRDETPPNRPSFVRAPPPSYDVVLVAGDFVFRLSESALLGDGWTVGEAVVGLKEVCRLVARAESLQAIRTAQEALAEASRITGTLPARTWRGFSGQEPPSKRGVIGWPSIDAEAAIAKDTRCSRTTVHRKMPCPLT